MQPIERAAVIAGGMGRLAALIGAAPSTPSMWKARGKVPAEWCWRIEQATKGLVTRQQLRPKDYWLVWPDLPFQVGPAAKKMRLAA